MAQQSKSDYFKGLRDNHLMQVGQRCIKDFLSLDELSNKQLKELMARARYEHLDDHPEFSDGTRWYHDVNSAVSQNRLRVPEVCRKLRVLIPEIQAEPFVEPFFLSPAVKLFETIAYASFGELDQAHLDDHMMRNMLTFAKPAPLILAWTRMCKEVMKGAVLPAGSRAPTALWTPEADLALMLHYKSKPGRTSKKDWEIIQDETYRTKDACSRRTSYLNQQLQDMLTWEQFHGLRVGATYGNEERARRAVLLIGVHLAIKRYKQRLTKSHPGVKNALAYHVGKLMRYPLPTSYNHRFFKQLL